MTSFSSFAGELIDFLRRRYRSRLFYRDRKKAKLMAGGNALKIVENAVAFKNSSEKKYDQYWIVFDKDDTTNQQFEQAIQLAKII